MRRVAASEQPPKYQRVLNVLVNEIRSGKYMPGDRFPSESALIRRFGTSRITVGRALRDLAQQGLVERIAGSGTYVRERVEAKAGLLFGLLIPDLGRTEILRSDLPGIAGAPEMAHHALLWAHMEPPEPPCADRLSSCAIAMWNAGYLESSSLHSNRKRALSRPIS